VLTPQNDYCKEAQQKKECRMMLIIVAALSIFLGLCALGMPVAFTLFVAGFTGIMWLHNFNLANSVMSLIPASGILGADLAALPLFILLGSFAMASGMIPDAYNTARAWLGRLPGGLGITTIAASAFFGACSGSSLAAAATIGKMAVPEMRKSGYAGWLSTSTCAAGGLLAIMIPPSGSMVIYGLAANVSIGRLLIAGILPGIMLAVTFAAGIYLIAKINPAAAPLSKVSSTWKERLLGIPRLWGIILIFLTISGGIFTGILTATEAAAYGALVALVVLVIKQRRASLRATMAACAESAMITCEIMFLILGAFVFSSFTIMAGLPTMVVDVFTSVGISPVVVIVVILAIYTVLGMFIDAITMMLITIPVFLPVITALGYDPIWFGVIVVAMVEIALLSPPFGVNAFILAGIAPDVPLTKIFQGSLLFIGLEFIMVVIVILFPQIALWLPSQMG
jgi:tripartite ATP-independent transporter DctM subunit